MSFPTSCEPKIQTRFDRAVAMLHSFWFQQVETVFQEVFESDLKCAIAAWSIATILVGLMSYNTDAVESFKRAAVYMARF